MNVRRSGFTLVEMLLATAVSGVVLVAAVVMFASWRSFYPSAGVVSISGQTYEYSPSPAETLLADALLAHFREDDTAAAQVVVADAEVNPAFVPTSGRLNAVLNASPYDLTTPSRTTALLTSGGVSFTANPGFTVFFLGLSANVVASYACSYVDGNGVRLYTVRRNGYTANSTVAYIFVEPAGYTQPPPGITLTAIGNDPASRCVQVSFPNPASRHSFRALRLDSITNSTQRAASVAQLSDPARYNPNVFYRR